MENKKQVLLFLTHSLEPQILKSFQVISQAFKSFGDTAILYHSNKPFKPIDELNNYKIHAFSDETLFQSGYNLLTNKIVPGSGHVPVLDFYKKYPGYSYYWLVENDVRFSGSWSDFFARFSQYPHDLITTHIRLHREEPFWAWWGLDSPDVIPLENRLRSFNTIYRLSAEAAAFLSVYLLNGCKGHYEMLLPTLMYNKGFSVMDFGGNGQFVPKELINKYYISTDKKNKNLNSGTMRHRPPFLVYGFRKNKLYHPVKGLNSFIKHYKERVNQILHLI